MTAIFGSSLSLYSLQSCGSIYTLHKPFTHFRILLYFYIRLVFYDWVLTNWFGLPEGFLKPTFSAIFLGFPPLCIRSETPPQHHNVGWVLWEGKVRRNSTTSLLGPEAEVVAAEVVLWAGQQQRRHVLCAPIHRQLTKSDTEKTTTLRRRKKIILTLLLSQQIMHIIIMPIFIFFQILSILR